MIHADTIEEVKGKMDIADVVGDFISLKKTGQTYRALSPFTSEKTPSFYVVPKKGIFKDFSSGKGGDCFTFLKEHEGMDYLEAIRYLAKKYGVEVRETHAQDGDLEARDLRNSLYLLMDFTKQRYAYNLLHHPEGQKIGLTYFRERGINESTIHKFELGYSISNANDLSREALSAKYNHDLLEKTGLVVTRDDGTSYDRFRERIMFPIQTIAGKTAAFGARIVGDKKQPKYLNSPETAIYAKRAVLYGLFQAKNAIRQHDNCYLVEGYMDTITLHQAGIENTVAASGTALSKEQISLIRRFTQQVTVLFDGDRAGINAALRGVDLILEEGLNVRVVLFPEGEDPDSYLRHLGAEAFQQFLRQESKDFISFKADLYASEAQKDPIRRAESIREIAASIMLIPDSIKRSVYSKEASRILDVDEAMLIAEINKYVLQARKKQRPENEESPTSTPQHTVDEFDESNDSPRTRVSYQEREIIRLLINGAEEMLSNNQKLIEFLVHELDDVVLSTPIYKEIYDLFQEAWKKGEPIDNTFLINRGSEEVRKMVATLSIVQHEVSPCWRDKFHIYFRDEKEALDDMVYIYVLRLKLRIVENMLHENGLKIRQAEQRKDHAEIENFLYEQITLDQAKKEFSEQLGITVVG